MRWLSSYKSLIYSSLLWIPSHPIFSRTWLPIYCLTKHCKSLSLPTESSPQLINMLYYLPPKKKKKGKKIRNLTSITPSAHPIFFIPLHNSNFPSYAHTF